MHRMLAFALLLLGSALWLQAQEGIPGLDRTQAPIDPPTVQGCLQNSAMHYYVVWEDGRITRLTGDVGWLSRYVGHEMEVKGKPTVIALNTTQIHAASTVDELPALAVTSAKELGQTCAAGMP